ncbi:MAG: universal stress protein [Akkermansiaceae bacterium]|nr:universal stress protein [Akkermansiaceae bacterium]
MNNKAPIIVGIDFSASSPFALRQAVHIGSLTGSPVVAVHVLNTSVLDHWAGTVEQASAHASLVMQAEARLTALMQEETPDAELLFEVCIGRPAEQLSRIVKERKAVLLVIAANDMTKERLGSISSSCVRTVVTDVLVTRDWQSGDFRKIVACTDLSATSGRVVEKAIELAEVNKAALEFVHVMYPPDKDYWGSTIDDVGDGSLGYVERTRRRVQDAMAQVLEPFTSQLGKLEHSSVILESTVPSVELSCHIKDTGADLVVLGTRAQSKLASIFVGTNAERLLHEAPVSVLAVRS